MKHLAINQTNIRTESLRPWFQKIATYYSKSLVVLKENLHLQEVP